MSAAFDDDDLWFAFEGAPHPFRPNDLFRVRGDVRIGSRVRFERVADDMCEIIVVDGSVDWRDGDTFVCRKGEERNRLIFVQVPPLAS